VNHDAAPTKRSKQPWRFDVKDAERPVDADAFLRRLTDVLLDVERDQTKQPITERGT